VATGKVKWFDKKKGYGFIEDEAQKEVFVHYSDVIGKGYRVLEPNDRVEFEPKEGSKGWQAKNVRVITRNRLD
jgi:CspA family cold shock protein